MTKYLISFPASAMDYLSPDELQAASRDSRAVVQEAKDAGVWVFGGGLDEAVPPVLVAGDGTTTDDPYPQTKTLNGGFTVIEVPTRDDAVTWAAKIAVGCRCPQDLREFMYDPES